MNAQTAAPQPAARRSVAAGPRVPHALVVAAACGLLCALASLIGNDYYLRLAFSVCVYYLCAAGMNVLVGYAGQKSLGQAGLFAAGAYTAALLTVHTSIDPWLALAGAMLVSAVSGVLIALPSLRTRGPYLAMVTLAFGVVTEKLVTEWTDVFGGAQGLFGVRAPEWRGQPLSMTGWVVSGIVLSGLVHLLLRNLMLGRFGRAMLSVQTDEIAASTVGVRVYRAKVIAFVIAAITCGLGGALVALQNQYINSDFINVNLSIFILLIVLFGGAGTVAGPLAGAVVLTVLDASLSRWPAVQHFVYGALLLFALFVMPDGLVGVWRSLRRRAGAPPSVQPVAAAGPAGEVDAVPPDDTVILHVESLGKSFGGVTTARDVTFRLRRGHVHALIGPNGAGKSTMINMLSGIVRPGSGRIRFGDRDVTRERAHRICAFGMARTFQNLRLFAGLSVLDNVLLGGHVRMRNGLVSSLLSLPKARREERRARDGALDLLRLVGLDPYAHVAAASLPYGLQRRVELARALASRPDLLLLDEPAAGLNPSETAELGRLLVRISRTGITILMVEHHMDLVMGVSDHVLVLDYGALIAEGSPAQVQADPRVIAAYLGTDDADDGAGAADSGDEAAGAARC